MNQLFERGVVVMSIDTEQIWGYLDFLDEARFEARYPNAPATHVKLLARLCAADVSATWLVVGSLALSDAAVPTDNSLWQCRSFLERLAEACPAQEIGLHGGLRHLIWKGAQFTREAACRELKQ